MSTIRWDDERPDVFVGLSGTRIMGRVVRHNDGWEWASYRNGVTDDCGRTTSFALACIAVESAVKRCTS